MPTVFNEASLKFLRSLARNNDREWFIPRKHIFEAELKTPMLALIEEINHHLPAFAPDYVRAAQKAMMRIYRDTRFSVNKQPYKTHLGVWWARHGLEKTSGGGFYLGLDAHELTISAGVFMPEPDQLLAIRRHLSASGGNRHIEFRRILSNKGLRNVLQPFCRRNLRSRL